MKRHKTHPQQPPHRISRIRMPTLLGIGICCLALSSGKVVADQPAKIRACRVAVVAKDLLTINCPKGRLGELLSALREQIGMESDVSSELAATPVSVAIEKAKLQTALDTILAGYNYSLDGEPRIVNGHATGTKVVVLGLRETDDQEARATPDLTGKTPEPTPTRIREEPSPPPETASSSAPSSPSETPPSETTGFAPGLPAQDPAAAAKAREAFFANLPAPGAALPPAATQVELPPSQPIQNSTGPGDGRAALPLPDFTPGPPSHTPPGGKQ